MTYRIAYGRDTESIEDHTQLVLLDLPDECAEMDSDELAYELDRGVLLHTSQPLVGLTDVTEALQLILPGAGLDEEMISNVISSLADALDNNDD